MFDHGPLATDHGAQLVMFAGSIFLKIPTAHHHDSLTLIFIDLFFSQIKAMDLGIPKMKDPAQNSFGFADHDVIATIAPLLALPLLYIGRGNEDAGRFLHEYI